MASRQPSKPFALRAVQPAPLAQQSPSLQFCCCCTHGKQARSATHPALLSISVPALPSVQLAPAAVTAGMPQAYAGCTAGHTQQGRRDDSFTPHSWANCLQSDCRRQSYLTALHSSRPQQLADQSNTAQTHAAAAPQLLLTSPAGTAPVNTPRCTAHVPTAPTPARSSPTCTARNGSAQRDQSTDMTQCACKERCCQNTGGRQQHGLVCQCSCRMINQQHLLQHWAGGNATGQQQGFP